MRENGKEITMKIKQILKVCDRCLCNTCNDIGCMELECSTCDKKYPIEKCEGHRGEKING